MKKLQTLAVTGVLTASIALGVGLGVGVGIGGGDAATANDARGVRTIVPTVEIAQPGVTIQGAAPAAFQPQPGIGPQASTGRAVESAQRPSNATPLAIQPGVGPQDSTGRAVAASPSTRTGRVAPLAIQPGVPTPSTDSAARSAEDWTALTFAAAYDQCAALSLHDAVGSAS